MIRSIRLRNFRAHEDTLLELAQTTCLVGAGGAGKSSVPGAIGLAFFSRNEWTDDRGSGMDTQVRHDARKAVVTVTFDDGFVVERTIPGEARVKAAELEERFGVPLKVARAVMDARYLLDLKDADQQKLLEEIYGVDPSDDELVAELNGWSPEQPRLGDKIRPHLQKARAAKSLHQWAYESRAAARKVKDDYESRLRSLEADLPPLVQAQGDVATLRIERDEIVRKIAESRGATSAAMELYTEKFRAYHDAMERHERAALVFDAAVDNCQKAHATADEYRSRPCGRALDEIQRDLDEHATKVQALARQRAEAQERSKLPSGPCPPGTCLKKLHEEQLRVDTAYANELEHGNRLQKELAAQKDYEAGSRAVAEALQKATEAWGEAKRQLGEIKIPKQPQKPGAADVEALEKQQEHLEGQIRAIEELERKKAERQAATQRLADTQELLAKALANFEAFEALEMAWNPAKGLPIRRMVQALRKLEATVNSHLAAFEMTDGFRITTDPWGLWYGKTPARQVSTSERALISLCLQVALARDTGFRFVVADKHDASALQRWDILAFAEDNPDLQFLIITSAQQTQDGRYVRPDPSPDGHAAFYWVEKPLGAVRCLPACA